MFLVRVRGILSIVAIGLVQQPDISPRFVSVDDADGRTARARHRPNPALHFSATIRLPSGSSGPQLVPMLPRLGRIRL